MNKNSVGYTIFFTFLSSFLLVVPLSIANEATKPLVAENRRIETGRAVLESLGMNVSSLAKQELITEFNRLERWVIQDNKMEQIENSELIAKFESEGKILYRYYNDRTTHWAGIFSGAGLWGTITLAIGFDENMHRIVGLQVIAQSETPGLGGRISESWFVKQFIDQKIKNPLSLNALGSGSGDTNKDDSAFDGISGATRSSESIRNIVNTAIYSMQEYLKGGI